MFNETLAFCRQHYVCPEGRVFASKFPVLSEAWRLCPRGDWMLWALMRRGDVPIKIFVDIARVCSNHVIQTCPGNAQFVAQSESVARHLSVVESSYDAGTLAYSIAYYAAWECAYAHSNEYKYNVYAALDVERQWQSNAIRKIYSLLEVL